MIKVFYDEAKEKFTVNLGGAVIITDPDNNGVILSMFTDSVRLTNGTIKSSKDGAYIILDKDGDYTTPML